MLKYKTYLLFLILICCCTLFTGCFDFVEDITLKANGSGTIKATLNLSKSKTKVASLLKLKSVNGISIPSREKIETEMQHMFRVLRSTPGITEVQYKLDFNNYIATVSCNFASVNSLNAFSKTLGNHFKSTLGNNNSYSFQVKTGTFTRSYTYPPSLLKTYAKLAEADKKYFNDAYYTQIIKFDQSVKSQIHPAGKRSESGKAVLLKIKALDLASGKATLANTIILNK